MIFKINSLIAILVLFLLFGNRIQGQDPDNLTLNQTVSGVKLYEATNSITLQPGFNYSATSSTQMVAKIIPTTTNSNYKFTETLESSDLNVVTSYPVGSINGSASVGATGDANYVIPIDIPPGRAGMRPNLSLVYNSKSGEGIMGPGWGLAGLSSITRVQTNFYHEGYIDEVDFDSNDKFALDGQRLINYSGNQYRTEIESFSKITLLGTATNPDSFKVETKDGMTLFYGYTADSRMEAQGTANRYTWKLNKVSDKSGNYYTITYTKNTGTGEIYASNINYTCYPNTTSDYSIEFGYEIRDIPLTSYLAGSLIMINKLLNLITIKNGSTTVGKYQMIYIDSKLKEVIKSGKNNSRLNSTFIDWGVSIDSLIETAINNPSVGKKIFGDYNGDGRIDLIVIGLQETANLYLSDSIGNFIFKNSFSLPENLTVSKFNTGDYNGDGLEDIVLSKDSTHHYFLISEGTTFDIKNYFLEYFPSGTICSGDFNGNGKTDLLFKIPNPNGSVNCAIEEYTFPSGGGISVVVIGQTSVNWGIADSLYSQIQNVELDMNGNGKTDLMVLDENGSRFYELQNETLNMDIICSLDYPTKSDKNLYGDFNGDGMTDIFTYGTGDIWTKSISKGNGFYQQQDTTFSGFKTSIYLNSYFSNDMNGDGKSDIVVIGKGKNIIDPEIPGYTAPILLHIGYSDGEMFNVHIYDPQTDIPISYSYFNFGDFNGDGVFDLYFGSSTTNKLMNTYRGKSQYFVSAIKNGFGYKTKFTYASLSNNSFYTKGTTKTFPVISYQAPIYNVSSIAFENPDHSYSTTNYSYHGANVHVQGKGFLGFEKVTSINDTTKLQSIEEFEYHSAYYNPFLKKSFVNIVSDSLVILPVSEATYTNSDTCLGGKRIFPRLDVALQKDFLSGVIVTKRFYYDENGNLKYQSETYDDGSYNKVTYSGFSSAGTWLPSKPETVVTIRKHYLDAQTYSLTTNYTYYANSGRLNKQIIGPVTTMYLYNAYGNPVSVRVSDGTTSRRDSFVYETKNMFISKSINALGHQTVRTYDYATGNVVTETAPNTNLVRVNTYNDFGVLTSTSVSSLGQSQGITYGWTTGLRPFGAVYYRQIVTAGAPTVKEYYDAFGRVLKTQKTGFDGIYVNNSYVYNNKGQLTAASTPWKQGEIPLKAVFVYDMYGRKVQESSDAGTANYTYSGKTVQVSTSGGQSSSKTMDSQGNVITSTDNGGTITYSYKSVGKPGSTSNNGSTWTMGYDIYGRQTSLTDPNAGTILYRYNKFGEMTRQLDANGNIDSLTYDILGRVATQYRNNDEGTKVFRYDPAGKPGLIDSVTYTGGSEKYIYDSKSRLINHITKIDGTYYSTKYGYDGYSRLDTLTYPSNFAVRYTYSNGYPDIVKRKDNGAIIWNATSMNSFNQYTQYTSGNGLPTTKTFDCLGMLRGITTGSIQNLGYSFDEETGNLISRRDNRRNLIEIFSYDNLGRLREVSGPSPLSIDYANNGNITSKTSVGDYSYGTKPHAVTEVDNIDGLIPTNDQRITYTVFNKVDSIIQSNYRYDLQYGYQDQRTISKLMNGSGVVQKTVYYAGRYEKEVTGSATKEFHYIYGGDGLAAILKRQSGTDTMYYVHKDHLGSFDIITNSSGNIVDSMSFDAWGRRRNPTNWTYNNIPAVKFSRGYTGHEHLEQFGLINMNGRMYDPILGRFLSVDPFIADPFFTQDFNRYSYVINNPLKYIDPSGYYKRLDDPPLGELSITNGPPLLNSTGGPGNGFGPMDWFNAFSQSIANGSFNGGIIDFSNQYEKFSLDPNFNGKFDVEHIDWFYVKKDADGKVSYTYMYTKEILSPAAGGGGINGNNSTGLPEWTSEANTGIGAFTTSNGLKTELIEYAGKSASLGKAGVQYLKYAKGLGYVGAGLSTTYSVANAGTYYYNGGTDWQVGTKATLDVIMTGVSFLGPIGLGIGATYFIIDAAGGFGDFGTIKP